MLYKPWVIGSDPNRQPRYQPVEYCTHFPMLGSFNRWNITKFTNKTTTNKDFDSVRKVALDGISDNIYALVQNLKYDAINTAYTTIMGCCVVELLPEPYMLQYDKIVDKKFIKAGEFIAKLGYLSIIKTNINQYWKNI